MTREWNGSRVMEEFAKIAAESGLITTDFGKPTVGNPDKETPVKDHRRYEPGEEYGVTKETGEDLVGRAHPKDAKPAEAMGEGALVENLLQQQKADLEVATRMPSGALVGKHAALVEALVALANDLEGEGKSDAAARIDTAIGRLAELPFVDSLRKEAFLGALLGPLKWILWGGAAGTAAWSFGPALVSKLTSTREELATDIQDVIDTAGAVREDSPSLLAAADKLRSLLAPEVAKFRKPLPAPGDEPALKAYLSTLEVFGNRVLPDARNLVEMMTTVKGGWWEGIGAGPKSRLAEKLKDMEATFQDTLKALRAAAHVGKASTPEPMGAAPETGPGDTVVGVQEILAENGFNVPRTGRLDDATKEALRALEGRLDTDLRRNPRTAAILDRRGWSIVGSVLRPDGTVMDPALLRRLLAVAGE
jgi:hypothetical protein